MIIFLFIAILFFVSLSFYFTYRVNKKIDLYFNKLDKTLVPIPMSITIPKKKEGFRVARRAAEEKARQEDAKRPIVSQVEMARKSGLIPPGAPLVRPE
jgi:hypothetical protein